MTSSTGNRRSTHVEMAVAYAAVGASKNPDLLRFPPEGSTPYAEELQLGSGSERFVTASATLMTWGAQRGAGVEVIDIDRGANDSYVGPDIDAAGQAQVGTDREEYYGPDGTAYVVAGTSATLVMPKGQARRVLVVYTVDEERCAGFAWGTSDTEGAVGEQMFVIEHRADGTVWAVARGFLSAPRSGLLGIAGRNAVKDALAAVSAQLAALAPGAAAPANAEASVEVAATVVATEDVAAENVTAEESAADAPDVVADPGTETAEIVLPVDLSEAAPDVDATAETATPDSDADEDQAGATARSTHQRRPSRPTQ